MPNNKIPPQRQEHRIGLIAFMLVAMVIAAPIVQAAANAKTPTCKIMSPKTGNLSW